MNTDKFLLKDAVAEIRRLRRQNEVLNARLSGFDDALLLVRATPLYLGVGMAEDPTYRMEKRIAEIENEENREEREKAHSAELGARKREL